MGARSIELEVDGVRATAELLDEISPLAAEALWQALPLEAPLSQSIWSGAACTFDLPPGPLAAVREVEQPVCSIYPGTLVLSPKGGELLLGHREAEYRRHTGPDYVSRVAHLRGNRTALLAVTAAIRDEGAKRLTIRRAE